LKKRTKKLLQMSVRGGSTRTPTSESFCFFFQKEALSHGSARERPRHSIPKR
jgi:hypothetical protein